MVWVGFGTIVLFVSPSVTILVLDRLLDKETVDVTEYVEDDKSIQ